MIMTDKEKQTAKKKIEDLIKRVEAHPEGSVTDAIDYNNIDVYEREWAKQIIKIKNDKGQTSLSKFAIKSNSDLYQQKVVTITIVDIEPNKISYKMRHGTQAYPHTYCFGMHSDTRKFQKPEVLDELLISKHYEVLLMWRPKNGTRYWWEAIRKIK